MSEEKQPDTKTSTDPLKWCEIDKSTDLHGIMTLLEASNTPEWGCLVRLSERTKYNNETRSTVSITFLPFHRVVDNKLVYSPEGSAEG